MSTSGSAPGHALDRVFAPRSVAVIGATEAEGSVGRTLFQNLAGTFHGPVFPVSVTRDRVLGVTAYRSIQAVPAPVDLAVIATPADTVPGIVTECVAAGVLGAVIISAGFKEAGAQGAALERDIVARARRGSLRIVGPNCLGIMNPILGLNATFAEPIAAPGRVAFVSQSGAICTAILDWSRSENVGFSLFASIGSMLDVGWGDVIDYLGDDPHTESIIMYMESIGDPRSFLSAARQVALTKPLIVIKAGRSAEGAKAAASHTGALTGSDRVLDAAFRRCGVLRVDTISDLFDVAEVLAKQPRPAGPRLTIVTNAGGPAVLATDALLAGQGQLAPLAPDTVATLDRVLPPHWSHGNPIDILGDADPDRYATALETAARDPNSDGLLVVLAPQGMTAPAAVAERVAACTALRGKPTLASWIGGQQVAPGIQLLNEAGIPTFAYPDAAARVFNFMWRYGRDLEALYETPAPPGDWPAPDGSVIRSVWDSARAGNRTLLTEVETKRVLAEFGIPVVPTVAATDEADAVRAASEIGYPVALKVLSETITHKARVGGVRLNLATAAEVREAFQGIAAAIAERYGPGHFGGVAVQRMITDSGYELILGKSTDPDFGPVMLFGSGGRLAETMGDQALALPPLTTTLAERMMERTKIHAALIEATGDPAIDYGKLQQLVVRFSWLLIDHPRIKEIEINPLLATGDGLIALDARAVLHPWEISDDQLPSPAIRPYPSGYVGSWSSPDGTPITIRPIRPEDEPLMATFHGGLSADSVHSRYFGAIPLATRTRHGRLARDCFIDYDRALALVAERRGPPGDRPQILGVARLVKLQGTNDAEFGLVVSDQYQRRGLGAELLRRLSLAAKQERLGRLIGQVLPDNEAMLRLCRRLGFRCQLAPTAGVVNVDLAL